MTQHSGTASHGRALAFTLLAALGLTAALTARAQVDISQVPAFLPTPLPPNILLTLDDSGSMRSAFVPDSLCNTNSETIANSRRFKSAAFNALYYDPNVRYVAPKTASGSSIGSAASNSFTAAYINGFYPDHGTLDLSSAYRPTLAYNPASNSGPDEEPDCNGIPNAGHMYARNPTADYSGDESDSVAAYYYTYNGGTGCTLGDDTCYTRHVVSATSGPGTVDINGDGVVDASDKDERQNFAHWYAYYRTRNLLTVSATSLALAALPNTARVGWQSLNRCSEFGTGCRGWGADSVTYDSRLKVFADSHRTVFYTWLFRLPASGSTPLRTAASRVDRYMRTTGTNSPWPEFPYDSTANPNREFSCRPNFHIALTDGLYNDNDSGSYCASSATNTAACGDADRTNRTLPDGKAYDTSLAATRVFRSSNSNALSDLAFHQWASDLRTDLPNNLLPYIVDRRGTEAEKYWNPRNDPATWQHIVTFTVGLGLTGSLTVTSPTNIAWPGSAFGNPAYTNFTTGTGDAPWPSLSPADPGRVYDLWHAAFNGRGEAFSAERPTQVVDALEASLNRVTATSSSAAALAASSTRVSDGTRVFQARFNSGDWSGELQAFPVNSDGSLGNMVWTTASSGKFASATARRMFTWSGSAGIEFTSTALQSANLFSSISATPAAATGTTTEVIEDDFVNWVRGDQSKEQASAKGIYRTRTTLLGDIVSSNPVFVGQQNFGYTGLPEGRFSSSTPYFTFYESQANRRKMVYVASNGGMLHGIDATNGVLSTDRPGVEQFAFVPQAVIPRLKALADPAYVHQFLLDGSPRVRDAFVNGGWKTVLIGTGGVGAKTVFALDVTDPDTFTTSNVLWEINSSRVQASADAADPDYANDLGLTVGQGIPVKLNNGEWGVIFGNGLNSTNHRAVLYVVRLSDGALIRKIDTGIGSALLPNGLGTPTLNDANGDQVFDIVYAPDNRGNVWKFNLGSDTPSEWSIAFEATTDFPNGAPLFSAKTAAGLVQPIQARVEIVRPPLGVTGMLVVFGTGRLLAVGDNVNTRRMSVYGILDNGSSAVTGRSQLQQQTISTSTATVRGASTTIRRVTSTNVDWTTKRGWYIDLPTDLERVIGTPLLRGSRMIFTTVIPSTDPCEFGGSGWLMQVSAWTGGELDAPGFDTSGDGIINSGDLALGGIQVTVGLAGQASIIDGTPTSLVTLSGTKGTQIERVPTNLEVGRNSWRQAR